MTRWAAGVEYLGTGYSGWQAQGELATVQGVVESALSQVAGAPISARAAGRTDAGVHAWGQVVHFDGPDRRTPYAWLLGGNSNLPADVSLRWVEAVADDFDARHSAISRRYRYIIHNTRARSAWLHQRATWVPQTLDAEAMHVAAQALLGERDFSAFRAAECQSSTPMRCVTAVSVQRQDTFVVLDIAANAFLHHMVRNITGSLFEVGLRRQRPEWIADLLAGCDRRLAGPTAPAGGLYFVGPEYPAHCGVPAPPTPWFPM